MSLRVNQDLTDWFPIDSGVKHGCILSPILFFMFINELVHDIKSSSKGINLGEVNITPHLYADDVVVLA